MSLPSTAVVDMFGRVFGPILATLVEKCPSAFSSSGEGMTGTHSRVQRSSDVGIEAAVAPGGAPGGDLGGEGVEDTKDLKIELSGLKKGVSDLRRGEETQNARRGVNQPNLICYRFG
jgi:hypothetical protein